MNNYRDVLTKIHIHPLLWLVVALSVATAHFFELSLLFFIIFIHEMGHALPAAHYGWRIKKISLLPFGGVAEMDEHGNRPLKEELAVIISGPLQHLWIFGLAFLLYQFSVIEPDTFKLVIQYNFMILLFNLLPIWPLDGGKLLFLWLSVKKPFSEALRLTILLSFAAIFIFAFVIILLEPINLNVWIILSFLLFSLYHEHKQKRFVFIRFLLERYYGKRDKPRSLIPLKVEEDELIIHVLAKFQRGCKHPIIIENDGRETGVLDENEVLHAYFSERLLTAKIRDLLYPY